MEFDLEARLPALLPLAIDWAEKRCREVLSDGIPLDPSDLELARAVGVIRPERIRVAIVEEIGLPEDEALRSAARATGFLGPSTAGLTLGYAVLLVRGHDSRRLRSHEFRHVSQYEDAGSIAGFLAIYLGQIVEHGYAGAPLEEDARRHEVR